MLKKDIITCCVKTALTIDCEKVLDELNAVTLDYEYARGNMKSSVHNSVQSFFLRGKMGMNYIEGNLEPSNPVNSPMLEKLPTIKTFLESIPGTICRVALLLMDEKSVILFIVIMVHILTKLLDFICPLRRLSM